MCRWLNRGLWIEWLAAGSNDGWARLQRDAMPGVADDFNPDRGQPCAEKTQAFCSAAAHVEHSAADIRSTVINFQYQRSRIQQIGYSDAGSQG